MKTVITIIKKEFSRFFKDYRLIITAILLPGLIIYAVYSIMGSIIEKVAAGDGGKPVAYVVNMPYGIAEISGAAEYAFEVKEAPQEDIAKRELKEGKAAVYVVFPADMPEGTPGAQSVKINIFYDSGNEKSLAAFNVFNSIISGYQAKLSNVTVNDPTAGIAYDLGDSESMSRKILSMIVPMLMLMLLYSGCMSVAPESIAGEKERGTIATLLVTPVKRSSIAIGKIVALSCIALLSGFSSAVGMLFSLPKLAGGGISFSMYGFGDYMAILGVVLSTVLVLVSGISVISTFAKSVKEATVLVVPLMLITMLCGIFSIFVNGAVSLGLFFIPLFNSALVISGVMSGTLSVAGVCVTVCVNVAFTALLIFVLALMFNSERIMFNK